MSDEFFIPDLNFDSNGGGVGGLSVSKEEEDSFVIPDLDFGAFEAKSELKTGNDELEIPKDLDLLSPSIGNFPSLNPSVAAGPSSCASESKNIPKIDLSSAFIQNRGASSSNKENKTSSKEDSSSKNPFTTILLVKPIPLSLNSSSNKSRPSSFGSVLRKRYFEQHKSSVVPNKIQSGITCFKFDTPSPDDDVLRIQKDLKGLAVT
eukprot:TRINITY_DN5233_c0_g1_i1.p1 TRINITY_DN5233_c0_g1~~TRINITY_DN5233_c0_g1_i1.p1  ORF type:complete len:206 (+),score=45.48 TRINITY_DN5233_c0_g1_i1:126-743(+)